MSASMKWRHFSHLKLLSRAVALIIGMVEMEVSPQEEMADPQVMKVFALEGHGLPEDFVSFPALCRVQLSPLVLALNCAIVWGPLQWQALVETLCFRFAFLVLKLDDQTLVHRASQPTWTLPLRAPAETIECASRTVKDGSRERLWSGCEPKSVSADQMNSTHATQSP